MRHIPAFSGHGFVRAALLACAVVAAPNGVHAEVRCTPFGPMGVQRCESGLPSELAAVFVAEQVNDQWCWAASIAMVFRHYGLTVPQEEIVSSVFGAPVNRPGTPMEILHALNREWTDPSGVRWRTEGQGVQFGPAEAAQQLALGRPLIIGTMGHAMVLTSVIYDRTMDGRGNVVLATVRDPWPNPRLERGRRTLSPQEWFGTMFLARIDVHRLQGGGGGGGADDTDRVAPRCETVFDPCEHPAHPAGDVAPCQHPAHPMGDVSPCMHPVMTPWGPRPMHPMGDVSPCQHPAHPMGDVSPCVHRAHPAGDPRRVCSGA